MMRTIAFREIAYGGVGPRAITTISSGNAIAGVNGAPSRPRDAATARLGWQGREPARTEAAREEERRTWAWMKEVAEETWQGRYGNRRRPGKGTGTGNHGETQAAESESHAGRGEPGSGGGGGRNSGSDQGRGHDEDQGDVRGKHGDLSGGTEEDATSSSGMSWKGDSGAEDADDGDGGDGSQGEDGRGR